jgi:hypothetical protein
VPQLGALSTFVTLGAFTVESHAMAITKMTRQWNRWAGTISDIERATSLAIEVLGQTTRGEVPCHIQIALPGRVTDADTPDALQTEIDSRDLTLIRSIRIEVGSKRGMRATIHVERQSPALTVEVSAENRTRVEGLISQLDELLRRGRRRPGEEGVKVLAVLALFGVTAAGARTLTALQGSRAGEGAAGVIGILAILLLALGGCFGTVWLLPGLELLEPGARTLARRFRGATIAFVLGVLGSLAATWIYDGFK